MKHLRKSVSLKLLSQPVSNLKAKKNIKLGYHTYFLSLAHSDISGYNVCPIANRLSIKENNKNKSNCSYTCVALVGNATRYPAIMKARIRKTKLFFENRALFMQLLIKDIFQFISFVKKHIHVYIKGILLLFFLKRWLLYLIGLCVLRKWFLFFPHPSCMTRAL